MQARTRRARHYLLQWLVIIVIAAAIAIGILHRPPPPSFDRENWACWEGFHVISFGALSRRPTAAQVDTKRFGEHLAALRDAGYQPVTPADVAAFLRHERPLPEKALLVLFEGGRKDSFLRGTAGLRQSGMCATMCVPTSFLTRRDTLYLRGADLKRLARDPCWSVGSMGHRAIEAEDNGDERRVNFLTQRLPGESDPTYRARVREDYADARSRIEQFTGEAPQIYIYPYADNGRSAGTDAHAFAANREAVSEHHALAFVLHGEPFNGPHSDRFSLSRLVVSPDWTPTELLHELEQGAPRDRTRVGSDTPPVWAGSGRHTRYRDQLRLRNGAEAWLRGSSHWTDGSVDFVAERREGSSLWLYLRYSGPVSTVRLGWLEDRLVLQEAMPGDRVQLWQIPVQGNRLACRIVLKQNRISVLPENGPASEILPLTSSVRAGRVGFVCAEGRVDISSFKTTQHPACIVMADHLRPETLQIDSPVTAALYPVPGAGAAVNISDALRVDLLRAAAVGIEPIPYVATGPHLTAVPAEAAQTLRRILRGGGNGGVVERIAVGAEGHEWAAALASPCELIHVLPAAVALERYTAEPAIARGVIACTGDDDTVAAALAKLARVHPSWRLMAICEGDPSLPDGVLHVATQTQGDMP